jgi:hypothetical protein
MSAGGRGRMKTLDRQMAIYAEYHRNRWNRLTHFIGVPAIIFAILIPMSWISIGDGVTLAHVLTAAVLAYYFLLDVPLALATAVATGALLFAARLVSETGATSGWIWFGVFFAGGSPIIFSRYSSPRFVLSQRPSSLSGSSATFSKKWKPGWPGPRETNAGGLKLS